MSRRNSVIELLSDSEDNFVVSTSDRRRVRQRRQARSTTPAEDPIVIPSDAEEAHSDGDVEITGEQTLAPPQRRAFSRQRPGFTLYQPNGAVFQPYESVRISGTQRSIAANRPRRRLRPRYPRRANNQRAHFTSEYINEVLRNNWMVNAFRLGRTDSDSSIASRVLYDLRSRVPYVRHLNRLGFMPLAAHQVDFGPQEEGEGDEIPHSIMDEIRRREQEEEDRRVRSRSNMANKMKMTQETKAQIPEEQRNMFSNGFSSKDTSVCILCGVPLVEGIPDDFQTSTDMELKRKLVVHDKFMSPWQFSKNLTTADKDLSRKVFFGRCGHVYCGRCINNINRYAKQKGKSRPKKRKTDLAKVGVEHMDLNDPEYSAPNRCVAQDCKRLLTGNYFFRELYV
ncbi:hypothetical protein KL930_003456 [Ogataea haglerorum]|uniref:Uncharacterized protein n=1 Tax=Ogataea haglerorum TaxID=1937702 RepID=A0AAN6D6R2_9ASCO|nr:uncharacterized protein KL911_003048 [Ogataea haglerorum]KAG7695459.1 hypothetical protein KL915_002849 [Ogataea haglerorum]KAG7695788.1 hypothetical protein KL951_003313 [Ogataea haglerorum]KAG7705788.1 hypothetical protein KL914_003626 [Ogataea haglerorum]KAG7707194.1 hypothetical protein KL950_002854 [Ogataea haglerorum]KAG7718512.1 hypothetical protein KL913_002507 [Ogataea haglerorum]